MSAHPATPHRPRRHALAAVLATALAAGATLLVADIVHPPDLETVLATAADTLGAWTYPLVAGLAFLETGAFVGLLAPGETAVVLGGALAARGDVSLVPLLALVWASAAAGDLASYALGRRLGRPFLLAHGRRVRLTPQRVARVDAFFARHGGATVLVGRFVGIVRAVAPFLAGASRLPLRRFLPYSVLGTGLWAALYTLLGYAFARTATQLATDLGRAVALAAAVAAIALLVLTRARRRPH
jgi:membrane protein DedA with SNARE-associated domain